MTGLLRIAVPTRGGGLTITTCSGPECAGCDRPATLELRHVGGGTVTLCGDCLATGLAAWLGAQHLRAGGRLEDLRRHPDNPPDQG